MFENNFLASMSRPCREGLASTIVYSRQRNVTFWYLGLYQLVLCFLGIWTTIHHCHCCLTRFKDWITWNSCMYILWCSNMNTTNNLPVKGLILSWIQGFEIVVLKFHRYQYYNLFVRDFVWYSSTHKASMIYIHLENRLHYYMSRDRMHATDQSPLT